MLELVGVDDGFWYLPTAIIAFLLVLFGPAKSRINAKIHSMTKGNVSRKKEQTGSKF